MEKCGAVILDMEDITEFGKGRVSQRLQENWDLTLPELKGIIKANKYQLKPKPTQTEEDRLNG